jgi:hypothetical protein
MGRPRNDALSQEGLLAELKAAIDAVRIAHPVNGPNPAARRTLRRLIRDNQNGVQSFKVLYNLGRERRMWFLELLAHEMGLNLADLTSPWKDDFRANGPLKGGHADRGKLVDGVDYDSSEQ